MVGQSRVLIPNSHPTTTTHIDLANLSGSIQSVSLSSRLRSNLSVSSSVAPAGPAYDDASIEHCYATAVRLWKWNGYRSWSGDGNAVPARKKPIRSQLIPVLKNTKHSCKGSLAFSSAFDHKARSRQQILLTGCTSKSIERMIWMVQHGRIEISKDHHLG